jgi:sugar lactone lactonase YvrE
LALDNVGNLYAGFPGGSTIWKFLPDGSRSEIGFVDSVSGLAFDHAGNLFITSPNYVSLGRLTYEGYGYILLTQPGSTNYTESNLSYPISPAFDSAGIIYVANNTNASPIAFLYSPSPYDNTIQRFTSNLTPLGAFATNLNNPWGLAFDRSGNLYVSSSGDDLVYRFTPSGSGSIFAGAGLSDPRGLAFDGGGNLYVANAGSGTIVKITPGGTSSVFASGLSGPTSIAIFPSLNVWSATGISLSNPHTTADGAFQFAFVDNPGLAFTALGTTNASLPLTNWTILAPVTEVSPGHYQFSDPQATNVGQRFYRIRSN